MQCRQVHETLAAGQPLSDDARAHVDQCEVCALLAGDDGALGRALGDVAPADAPPLPAGLQARLDAPGLRGRLSSWPTSTRAVAAVLGALLVPAIVAAVWRRPDMSAYPVPRLVLDALTFAVPAGLALWLALRPLHRPPVSPRVPMVLAVVGSLAMLALVVLPVAHHDHPASLLGIGDDLLPRARACFITGTLAGLPVLLWVRVLLRDDRPWWAVVTMLAIAAALVGGLSIFLHCPLVSPKHLAAGHATILVPFVILALFGRRR